MKHPTPNLTTARIEADGSIRSPAGTLLARLVEGGVEFKCRRSRKLVLLAADALLPALAAKTTAQGGETAPHD